jgi:hypothetical protein
MKIFLGGTCNNSTWREELIPLLNIEYFNPVVKDWTPECQAEEIKQREECGYCLYVLTPKMTGYYSIAEVVDDSNKRPEKTVLCILPEDEDDDSVYEWTSHQIKSFQAVAKLVAANGGYCTDNLEAVAKFVNDPF